MKFVEASMHIAVDGKKDHTSADWYAALMDFGSLVQTKRNPRWDVCPLTAKKIMRATPKNFPKTFTSKSSKEPGRSVGGKHIPNRIFRGRIVESLRDAKAGLTTEQIGANISVDWNPTEHREWLQSLLKKLTVDRLIDKRKRKYVLAQ
jgi:adenine-specific DNA glycosylase